MARSLIFKFVVLVMACTQAVPSRAAKRTFKYTKGNLPVRLYEQDIGSAIDELQTQSSFECALMCAQSSCRGFLFKHTELPTQYCYSSPEIWKYTGNVSVTDGNKICQRWDTQSPHLHSWNPYWIADSSLSAANNYCRDVSKSGYPWCYTTDPFARFQKCNLFRCFGSNNNCRLYNMAGNPEQYVAGYSYYKT